MLAGWLACLLMLVGFASVWPQKLEWEGASPPRSCRPSGGGGGGLGVSCLAFHCQHLSRLGTTHTRAEFDNGTQPYILKKVNTSEKYKEKINYLTGMCKDATCAYTISQGCHYIR